MKNTTTTKLHPAVIGASSLPIYAAAVERFPHLGNIPDALHFCRQLCRLAAVSTITVREYDAIARVANGELWPSCLVLDCMHQGRRGCRIMSATDIAVFLQPGLAQLLDSFHVYRVDARGAAVELQLEVVRDEHMIKFWTAGGELVASGKYDD